MQREGRNFLGCGAVVAVFEGYYEASSTGTVEQRWMDAPPEAVSRLADVCLSLVRFLSRERERLVFLSVMGNMVS